MGMGTQNERRSAAVRLTVAGLVGGSAMVGVSGADAALPDPPPSRSAVRRSATPHRPTSTGSKSLRGVPREARGATFEEHLATPRFPEVSAASRRSLHRRARRRLRSSPVARVALAAARWMWVQCPADAGGGATQVETAPTVRAAAPAPSLLPRRKSLQSKLTAVVTAPASPFRRP